MHDHYDVLIVGAGAGGGTLAYALANSGKRILLLERGDYLPQEEENWDPSAVFLEQRYQIQDTWYDSEGEGFKPEMHYCVGGNTKVYGAVLQRMREKDFQDLQHCDGVSPGWPISYGELEPYYSRAESIFKVHSNAGEDPTEPPLSANYPFKAMPHAPRIQEVADALGDRGLTPFHAPLALNRNVDAPNQSLCIRCDTCDPFPCKINAKMDAQTACIDPALKHDNITLITGATVERLHTDESGRKVKAVEAKIDGNTQQFTAERVVLSCGAVNSAVLLLKSANKQHPNGLANSSGLVGRNLTKHNHSALIAVAPEENKTIFQKTLAIHDFYFSGPQQDYPLGQIQLTGKAKWQRLKHMAPKGVPDGVLKYVADHSVDWWITSEDLPDPDNRVTLNDNGEIQVHYKSNNMQPHQALIAALEAHLRAMGFYMFWHKFMGLGVLWHQAGTCRFGTDPTNSVLDVNCKAHDLDNLYVVDASFMPSMGAVNLTLTIVANALRVGDYMKTEMGL